MKLSIITVNLNNREGLQRTINSVIAQTWRDFEWIVIDGGSTDGSKELIEQYSTHFAYWVSEPDSGVYNAMNKGIRVAKGEYCQFLNSGDWIYSDNTLEKVFNQNPNGDIIYGDMAHYRNGMFDFVKKYESRLPISLLLERSIGHQSSFIRTSLLIKDPYDEQFKIVSDWKFYLRKALQGYTFQYIDLIVCAFDLGGISYTQIDLRDTERQHVIQQEVPDCIMYDYQRLTEFLNKKPDPQLLAIEQYRSKRKVYHKMTTALLLLMNLMEKILGKNRK